MGSSSAVRFLPKPSRHDLFLCLCGIVGSQNPLRCLIKSEGRDETHAGHSSKAKRRKESDWMHLAGHAPTQHALTLRLWVTAELLENDSGVQCDQQNTSRLLPYTVLAGIVDRTQNNIKCVFFL